MASIETLGDGEVPNKVGFFSAEASRASTTSASITLSWQAPPDFNSTNFPEEEDEDGNVTASAGYLIEYRLDIPDRIEPEDEWKKLTTDFVSITATSAVHTIALEEWKMTSTAPKEYVPTAQKTLLRLHNTETADDWILPFGITYEYRIRAVSTDGNMSLPALSGKTRIPNQEGLPPRVLIYRHNSVYETVLPVVDEAACYDDYGPYGGFAADEPEYSDCLAGLDDDYVVAYGRPPLFERPDGLFLMPLVVYKNALIFRKRRDGDGNMPTGYRILVASDTTRFHERGAVRHYEPIGSDSNFGNSVFPYDSGGFDENDQRIKGVTLIGLLSDDLNETQFVAVQAYDGDGVGKGDGWRVREVGAVAYSEPGSIARDNIYLGHAAEATAVTENAGGG